MAEGDSIRFEATFDNLDEAVRLFTEELSQQLAKAEAMGEEAIASSIRSQIERVAGPTTADIEASAEATQRLNALKRQSAQLDAVDLDVVRETTAALEQQAAMRERLQRAPILEPAAAAAEPTGVILPPARRALAYEQLAGAQAAAEERARIREQVTAAEARPAPSQLIIPDVPQRSTLTTGERALIDEINAGLAEESRLREQALRLEQQQLAADRQRAAEASAEVERLTQIQAAINEQMQKAYGAGQLAAGRGRLVAAGARDTIAEGPAIAQKADMWGPAEESLARYNISLGEYDRFASTASLRTEALNANLLRSGIAQSEASNEMRRHGALTTEYIQALARGETTVSEFGYQVGATVAKFAGWTAAATATYAALGALAEFSKGAIDSASSVQQLSRTIENLDRQQASTSLQDLSAQVNVPMKEAGDAVFQFSRTFHSLPDAVAAARVALAAYKLDGVEVAASVRTATGLQQQFGVSGRGLADVYNMLAAGQRNYNARITELIPLLGRAGGAVATAGGQLDPLVQLGIYAQHVAPGIGGSQIGTAFARSAATFLSPSTRQGVNDRAILQSLGINPNQGWTSLMRDALVKSVTLDASDRARVATAIFGPRYGASLAALFNPRAVQGSYEQITGIRGDPRRAITPGATRDALQTELQRQLHTSGEELRSFVNELQRMGAALATSGVVTDFTAGVRGLVWVLGEVRQVTDAFGALPPAMRQVVMGAEALGVALLFLSRTRFGATVADLGVGARDASGLRRLRPSRLPFVGPDEAQRATFGLRVGTRAAQDAVEADVRARSAQILRNNAEQVRLERQRAVVQGEINAAGQATEEQLARSNRIDAEISALKREQAKLEIEQNAATESLQALNEQQTRLRRSARRGGFTSQERLDLAATAGAGTAGAGAAVTEDTAAQSRLAAMKTRVAGLLRRNAAAEGEMAAGMEAEAGAAAAATAEGAAVATETAVTAGVFARMNAGFARLTGAFDPLLIGLLAVPFAVSEIGNALDQVNKANEAATQALNRPITSLSSLQQSAADLNRAAQEQARGHAGILNLPLAGVGAILRGWPFDSAGRALQRAGLGDEPRAANTRRQASALTALGQDATNLSGSYARDSQALADTTQGRQRLYEESQRLRAGMLRAIRVSGLPAAQGKEVYQLFNDMLQQDYQQGVDAAGTRPGQGPTPFVQQYETDLRAQQAQLTANLQSYADLQKAFGTNNENLQGAFAGLAAVATQAARPGNRNNAQLLQALTTAQSQFTGMITGQVQMYLTAAQLAPTFGGEMSNIQRAINFADQSRTKIQQWFTQAIAAARRAHEAASVISSLQELEGIVLASAGQAHQQAVSAALQAVQTQTTLQVSAIPGISPEADLARARVNLAGLRHQLAVAQEHGADANTIAGLQAQVNDAQRGVGQQSVQNTSSLLQAQEQLRTSAITGITPAADLARARQNVDNARQYLQWVRTSGLGQTATIQAQQNLDQAVYSLNQQIVSNAQQTSQDAAALIQATGALQQAQTLDPIQQAREQLATDTRVLGTIRPNQFKTYAEYLAAYRQQQAKVAQDERNTTSTIVSTRMATLRFQFDTQRISEQQYLNGLQSLLRLHHLTRQQVQQIQQEIYNTAQSTAVNLNTGNIHLPTTYEVRRAFTSAVRAGLQRGGVGGGQAGQPPVVQNNQTENHINIVLSVARNADLRAVTQAIDSALNGNLTSQAQAAGVLGS